MSRQRLIQYYYDYNNSDDDASLPDLIMRYNLDSDAGLDSDSETQM